MPLIQDIHSDLPLLDATLTPSDLEAAKALIQSELPQDHATTPHPSLDTTYEPKFSEMVTESHASIAATGKPRPEAEGINLSRYEEVSPPEDAQDIPAWRESLRTAAVSQQYLYNRQMNLNLLEKYGKNAWLIGNSQMEDQLRYLERELKAAKEENVTLDDERKRRQEAVRGELEGLNEIFRTRLGSAVEAEVAGADIKRRILEARRNGA